MFYFLHKIDNVLPIKLFFYIAKLKPLFRKSNYFKKISKCDMTKPYLEKQGSLKFISISLVVLLKILVNLLCHIS